MTEEIKDATIQEQKPVSELSNNLPRVKRPYRRKQKIESEIIPVEPKVEPKKITIKKASVIAEFPRKIDVTEVKNPDPDLVYKWCRKDRDEEINYAVQKGYVPARGKERIFSNPLEGRSDGDGCTKERGNRILMCCPKQLVEAREQARLARQAKLNKSGKSDAQRIMQENKGSIIEIDTQSETVRERLKMED